MNFNYVFVDFVGFNRPVTRFFKLHFLNDSNKISFNWWSHVSENVSAYRRLSALTLVQRYISANVV
jgi:hypothetical protein